MKPTPFHFSTLATELARQRDNSTGLHRSRAHSATHLIRIQRNNTQAAGFLQVVSHAEPRLPSPDHHGVHPSGPATAVGPHPRVSSGRGRE